MEWYSILFNYLRYFWIFEFLFQHNHRKLQRLPPTTVIYSAYLVDIIRQDNFYIRYPTGYKKNNRIYRQTDISPYRKRISGSALSKLLKESAAEKSTMLITSYFLRISSRTLNSSMVKFIVGWAIILKRQIQMNEGSGRLFGLREESEVAGFFVFSHIWIISYINIGG